MPASRICTPQSRLFILRQIPRHRLPSRDYIADLDSNSEQGLVSRLRLIHRKLMWRSLTGEKRKRAECTSATIRAGHRVSLNITHLFACEVHHERNHCNGIDGGRAEGPLSHEELERMNAYWRAANYLSVGQIYLKDNPLLERPLTLDDVKPRLLGHWGTTPGLNFIYAHLNRLINERDLNMMYIIGPGHGGPGIVANTYLEGSYTEIYPHIEQNADGIKRLFRQFSWPYGIPSHVAPETPGSIHEGGELGYSLLHAYGAAFDNPDLIVACIVGDGEAETGPLATSWHSNKFLNPATDGAVLPILHLNGYKIANPTVLARIPHDELEELLRGYGYEPFTLEGDDPTACIRQAADVFDKMLRSRSPRSRKPRARKATRSGRAGRC